MLKQDSPMQCVKCAYRQYKIFISVCSKCDWLSICNILCDSSADKWIASEQMMHPICEHALGFAVKTPNFSKASSHGPTATRLLRCLCTFHMYSPMTGSERRSLQKGRRDNRINWEWVVWLLWGDRARDAERMWRRNLYENEHTHKEKERFGRSKIIVTLSLDSTHYFSIQWAQCWRDMAEIQLQNTFDSTSWNEAVDLQCHTVSA